MMCPAVGTQPVSQTALSKPPGVGVMNHLWVVPYAARRPPMLVGSPLCRPEPILETQQRGAQHMPFGEDKGATPPCGKHSFFCPPCSLWVVPYAGRNPP